MDTRSPEPGVILARKQVMIDSQGDQDLAPEKPPLDPSDWHIPRFTVKNKLRVVRMIHHKELSSLRNGDHLLSGWRDCFECKGLVSSTFLRTHTCKLRSPCALEGRN